MNNGGKIKIEHKSIWLASYFEQYVLVSKLIFFGCIFVVLLLSMCICVSGNRIKNNNIAYSNDARATRIKHIKNQQLIAFKPLLSGLCCIMLVITFIIHNTILFYWILQWYSNSKKYRCISGYEQIVYSHIFNNINHIIC